MPTTESDGIPSLGSFEELVAFYGPPVANTRQHGPVWLINGELIGVKDILDPDQFDCGCL